MDTKKIKVASFQFSPCSDIRENMEAVKRGIILAAKDNVRLLLTQECALCGYPPIEIDSVKSINQNELRNAIDEIAKLSQNMKYMLLSVQLHLKMKVHIIQL